MTSWDVERQRKLINEFDNIFQEHNRLQQDLNSDQIKDYQPLINSIDQWEQDAIKKIKKTAETARNDIHRLFESTKQKLKSTLNDAVTEELREALKEEKKMSEFPIDRWLADLSEIRKLLEQFSSTIDFSYGKVIHLIKVKQNFPINKFNQRINLNHQYFNFEKIRGRPIFHDLEHLISSERPAIIASQKQYSNGAHFFRFRIERTTDELFFWNH